MRLTVTKKLLAGFTAISLLLVLLGLFSVHVARQIVSSFEGGEAHFRSIVVDATEAMIQVKEAESQLRLYVTLHDERYKEAFEHRLDSLKNRVEILDRWVRVEKAMKVEGALKESEERFLAASAALLRQYEGEMAKTGGFNMSENRALLRALNETASAVRDYAVKLAEVETDFLNKQAAITAATEAGSFAKRAEGHLMQYLTLHDPVDRDKFFSRIEAVRQRVSVLAERVDSEEGKRLVGEMTDGVRELNEAGTTLLAAYDAGTERGSYSIKDNLPLIQRLNDAARVISERSLALVRLKARLEQQRTRDALERAAHLQTMMVVAIGGALLITVALGLASMMTISRPLRKLRDGLNDVAKGKFDANLQTETDDEVGDLGRAFNEMVHDLDTSRAELLMAKDYLDGIFRSMGESLIVVSQDGIVQTVNKATKATLGYDEKDLVGRPMDWLIARLLGPDVEGVRELLGSAGVRRLEKTCVRKDGSEIKILFSNAPLHGPEGQVQGVVWVVRDITERKLAEEALKKSEEQFRLLFEHAPIGVAMGGLDGQLVRVNRALCEALGFEADELLSMNLVGIIHPDEPAPPHPEIEDDLLAEEASWHQIEKQYVRKDGSLLSALTTVSIVRDVAGRPVHFIAHVLDITARKRAEEALARSYHQNQLLLEAVGEGLYGVDGNGRVTFINPAALEMLGHEAHELIGKPIHDLIHYQKADGSPYPFMECPMYRALKEGRKYHVAEDIFWKRDGRSFPVEFVCTPIREEEAIVGSVVVFIDITERKKMEEELMRARKLESVAVLASGVAHDFNNLLTGVLSCLCLAKNSTARDSELFETLSMAEDASRQARALTHELFSIARIGEPRREVVALERLVRDTARFTLSGSRVSGQCSFPADLWPVALDEGQISRVIHNLVINAAESMPEGGEVTISAENVRVGGEDPLPLKEGDYVRITVRDQGPGIPQEHISKVFDPYFTTKRRSGQKGMGLGLTICYSIVKSHNGIIAVDSKVGVGTSFHIYLPAETDPARVAFCASRRGDER
ncbi:MAG: PAS domain S-box protein [Chloroflexota bacterium]